MHFFNNNKLFQFLKNPGKSLSRRTLHGGLWSFLLRVVTRGIGLVRVIILANLLGPEEFGLFGIALVTLGALKSLARTGIDEALIQNKKDIGPYLNSAWTVRVVKGAFLAVLLYFGSPFVAAFFNEPRVLLLVRVLAVTVIFRNFRNIGIIYFKKDLQFYKRFVYEVLIKLGDFSVAVVLGFMTRSIWALVAGSLTASFLRWILSYILHPYRPRLKFDFTVMKELFDFGKWVFGSSTLTFLTTQGDDIFVGRLLGADSVGLYQMAYRVPKIIRSQISKIFSTVVFPALSKLEEESTRTKEAFLRSFEANVSIVLPFSGIVILLSPEFVKGFLGSDWIQTIPIMQALSAAGLIWACLLMNGTLFHSKGKPNFNFWAQLIRLIIVIVCIYPLTKGFGLIGTSVSILVANVGAFVFSWIVVLTMLELDFSEQFDIFWPTALSTVLFAAVVGILKSIFSVHPIGAFFLYGLAGAGIYLGAQLFIWRKFKRGPVKLLLWGKEVLNNE